LVLPGSATSGIPEEAMEKHVLDPEKMDSTSLYKIIAGSVVPRPIGFISTISSNNVRNAAPYSFFNAISPQPPMLIVSISQKQPSGDRKDTLKNLIDTGEFVVNIVSEQLAVAQDICAHEYDTEVDEFAMARITGEDSVLVRAPRIKESLINFECRVFQVMPLPESTYTLVIGRICMMHIHPEVLEDGGRVNLRRLQPIGRLVGNAYCHTRDQFVLNHDTFTRPGMKSAGKPAAE
jgi:flavin reductase (DIM6/NTAB) family NADH-FMN oxidoreductase RutF